MADTTLSLASLPTFDRGGDGAVTVVIETSKGSRNKLAYDVKSGSFHLRHILPKGSSFPYDFGFVPGTVGADGDPVDVLVFLEEPVPAGTVVAVRLIGVIEATQRESGGEWVENDRFLAVPAVARDTDHIQTLDQLRPGLVDELEAFFTHYNKMRGIDFHIRAQGGPERAHDLLRTYMRPERAEEDDGIAS